MKPLATAKTDKTHRGNLHLVKGVHGWGVMTAKYIHAGERILPFKGPLFGRNDLPQPYTSQNDYYLQIGPDQFMGPSGDLDDYVNHSCNPNAGLRFDGISINLIAIADIQAGQEITFDYSSTMQAFGFEMACACGTPNCRGIVKDFIHIPNETQRKYIHMGIVPDYIVPTGPGRIF